MTELKQIRHDLGLSVKHMALALGYQGNDNTNSVLVRQMESGSKPTPTVRLILARMYQHLGYVPWDKIKIKGE